ncbi:hypothetical protein RCIP0075_00008 [Klebsiella phage RCIP0075]
MALPPPPLEGYAKVIQEAFKGSDKLPGLTITPEIAHDLSTHNPFLTYSQAGGQLVQYSEGVMADKRNARLQLDLWCDHPGRREQYLARMLDIIAAHPRMLALTEPVEGYDRNINMYHARFDVSVWWDRVF